MAKAELNNDQIATVAGDITVFNYDSETREYLSSSVEFLAVGVGLPANACTDAPGDDKPGYAICRTADLSGWEYVADHRGETVYKVGNGEAMQITAPGDYPAETTTLAPATCYDQWNGKKWVTDLDAQQAAAVVEAEEQKKLLLAQAQEIIRLWQTELQLDIISDEDKASLIDWLKYMKALQVTDISNAPDISWPKSPA